MNAVMTNRGVLDAWELVPLKELGLWSGGGTPSKSKPEFWTNGKIPWVSPKDMKTERITDSEDHITEAALEESTAKLIPAGSILVVTRSGILSHTLPVAVTTVPVTVNQDLKAITPKDGVLPEYVAWALRCFAREILNTCSKQGTTVASIETAALHRFEIPVAPLDQQKRIVAEIEKQFSRLDEAVANLKRVKANLKRYKAAVLKAAVEGRLVESEAELARREGRSFETGAQLLQRILETRRSQWKGKGKYKEPAAPDTTDLPELPEGWVWASLDQLSWDSSYGTSAKCAYENKGPPVLRIPNVDKAAIDLADVKYAPNDLTVAKEESLSPGDMLVIRTNGSKSLIGRAAVVTTQFQRPTTYASYLIRFRLLEDAVLSAWVLSYWQSHSSRSWIESKAATSAGQHNISMTVLATAPIPLSPADEQDRIVAEVERRLSIVRETEAQADANLTRAESLRQSILARVFSGSREAERPAKNGGRNSETMSEAM
jgi:type I restriction enzyme S subunit